MVTFRHLREADPAVYEDIAAGWARPASALEATSDDIKREVAGLGGWWGDAADVARDHLSDVRREYRTTVEYAERVSAVLRTLADSVSDAQQRIGRVMEIVDSTYLLSVDPDTGTVRANAGGPGDTRTDEEKAENRRLAEELGEEIQAAVDDATEADQAASRQLNDLMPADAGLELQATGADRVVRPSDFPDAGDSAAEVKEWWDELSPLERESAIYTHPDRVGSLDGIPVEARDRANRILFEESYADVKARYEALDELGEERTSEQQREFDQLAGTRQGLEAINDQLGREPSEAYPQAYPLDFDTEGHGRGILATGNPDTAENTVTQVPGTESGLHSMASELEKADQLIAEAGFESGGDAAVVTWIGYDAPQDLGPATNAHYAEDAAADLRSFQDGLRATHEGGGGHNTVLGHSYGSTVIGHAAGTDDDGEPNLDVDNMVFVGSPGVGVGHASELGIDTENVYATTAENDVIRGTPRFVHDKQPISADFGAHEFPSDPGPDGDWYTLGYSGDAHSAYWHDDSDSLENIVTIAVGGTPDRTDTILAPGADSGDVADSPGV
ncbi:Alpha/beta hydrolase [Haloechinothrix alba]|uniref:Alpha/beta hydrolase n=1 Tax=Haloechinothrix alba TaxID=664784 RepID=A0A238X4P1_9PSEU|nr:alpha/beta hydrolase [Haloechinothrix alba]SNR53553.1 Alpha/beta hydrolase [Haloechinothrix alba]